MTQRVPSWDLEDVNPKHDIYKLDYEVAELTWENGQLALHELGSRRVPSKSQPTPSWDMPRAAETLEALVNQATLQAYYKTDAPFTDEELELVPWMHYHAPPVSAINLNESTTMTSDALVPNSNNRTSDVSAPAQQRSIKSARDAGCSTRASSCGGNLEARRDPRVARGGGGGGTTTEGFNFSSCRDMSVSGTFVTPDTYAGDLSGRRVTSTSTGSPENTSSGRDFSNSTFPDDSGCHRKAQRETKAVTEKKKEKAILNTRRRTAAIHNLSERKRRDKINQKLKTLQKLVPNSSKTDKASMLDEVIEHIKQLQVQVHTANMMSMSPMMMSLALQQQLQFQKYMMNPMGMGMGMGMGGMDMTPIGPSNIPARFHPSAFMQMPCWNNRTTDQPVNTNTMPGGSMPAYLASRSQPPNMESYNRMAALYQHMQNQPCGPFPKN